jgi:hypothetical protein
MWIVAIPKMITLIPCVCQQRSGPKPLVSTVWQHDQNLRHSPRGKTREDELAFNSLGLTIVHFRADQAFE